MLMLVRPEFSDTLAIRKGRYPLMPGQEFVANDAYASQTCRFQILTGPNMSGKSTYLRQIALLSVMAQIGSLYSPPSEPAERGAVYRQSMRHFRLSSNCSRESQWMMGLSLIPARFRRR